MKMKILFMHQSSSIGGGSYCLLNILKVLDRTLWEPVVALKSEGPLVDELRRLGVETVFFRDMAAIPYNRGLLQRGSMIAYRDIYKSIPALNMLLKDKHIDVLYLNNMMLCRYLQPAKECGCKTVVHVREHWPMNEHKLQLEWARKCVYRYADKMITINNYSTSMFPKKEATIVYDWIDMDSRYRPMPLSEIFGEDMTGKKVLLYTGGISSIKGPDYILRAFTKCVKGGEYRLLMLGCKSFLDRGRKHQIKMLLTRFGYRYWGLEMQKLVNSDSRICCIDGVYDLKDIIMQSHCFVSYFRIPHANLALAENIILGNACIAADTEEAREYSCDGRSAMLVSPLNDENTFSSKLQFFLSDIDKWKKTAEDGSMIIAEMFNPQKNANTLNGVLRDLIADGV